MLLIVLMIASSYFFYTLAQNTSYNASVREKNQLDLDRMSESAVAYNSVYTLNGNSVNITTVIKNNGPSPIRFTTIWLKVNNTNYQNYNCNPSVDTLVSAGDAVTKSFTVSIVGIPSGGNSYTSWLMTSRGNTVPLVPLSTQNIIVAQVSQGIGSIAMNFSTFVYRTTSDVGSGSNHTYVVNNHNGPGFSGYSVPSLSTVAFTVTLINFDEKGDVYLSSSSALWVLFPTTSQQPRGAWWYIVNVSPSTGKILPVTPSTQIRLIFGQPTNVTFASISDTAGSIGISAAGYAGPSAANLMLFGQDAGMTFGQNIPFVSIKFS